MTDPASPPPAPRQREWFDRYPYGSAMALSFVLAVGLCFALVTIHQRNERPLLSAPEPYAPSVAAGEATGSVVLSSDGKTLLYTGGGALCDRPTLRAAETPVQINLMVKVTTQPFADCDRATAGRLAPTAEATIDSAAGERPVIDTATGQAVPVFVEASALVATLTGWQEVASTPGRVSSVMSAAPDFGGPGAAVYAKVYRPESTGDQVMSVTDQLWIIEVLGGGWHPPAGTVTTEVTVRGHSGQTAPGILVWTEHGRTHAIRWNTAGTAPTTAALVAIANSLAPAGTR